MLTRAFPAGAPPQLSSQLEHIRGLLAQIQDLRTRSLGEQRKLEALESEARETRARMGHAMHVLGEDLSAARTALREAEARAAGARSGGRGDEQAAARAAAAYQALAQAGGLRPPRDPDEGTAALLRALADSLDAWSDVRRGGAAGAAQELARRQGEVQDLQFQVQAMRQALDNSEGTIAESKASAEQELMQFTSAVAAKENELVSVAGVYCESLRPRRNLGDLFAQLETQR